jgi:hypothetical protein
MLAQQKVIVVDRRFFSRLRLRSQVLALIVLLCRNREHYPRSQSMHVEK